MLWYMPVLAIAALITLAVATTPAELDAVDTAAAEPAESEAGEIVVDPAVAEHCEGSENVDTCVEFYEKRGVPEAEPVVEEPEPEPAPEPEPPVIEEEPEPTTLEVGDSAELTTDGSPSETITVKQLKYSTSPYDDYGSGPKNKTFLIFTLRIDAMASTDVYDGDFYVDTKDGERVDQGDGNSLGAVDYNDVLGWAELNAGQHKTGLVVFDSPVKHGTLSYDPKYEGEPIVNWEF